jgi:hypothetical protein
MVKMKFFRRYEVDGKTYEAGKVYEIEETPGTVDRWVRRGCQIIDEREEEKEVEKAEEVKEDKKEKTKKKTSKKVNKK